MEEESSSSWLRRVKYSHTVCHRSDSSILFSVTPNRQTVGGDSGLKSRPGTSLDDHRSGGGGGGGGGSSSSAQINSSIIRHRSMSPVPEIGLSDAFKEARSAQKRFSTPLPRTNEPDKRVIRKSVSSKESRKTKAASGSLSPSSTSPLRHFSSSMKEGSDKSKSRKDSSAWAKYFDHGGGRVMAVEMNDELIVDLSELLVGVRFACGANSRLYHGIYKDQPVAVKIIRQPDDDENGAMAAQLEKQFDREVIHLSRLHHKNVIKLVAACRQPPVFCIITEYLAGGSLRAFLHKLEHKSLPSDKLVRIALDIARGMEYIHSQGVVHRDLKPENLLFDEEFQMKIVDFGIACKEAYCESLVEDPGTYRWMAPEMIKRKSHGRKVDVYSFGLILWEMVAGRTPFEDKTPIQAAFAVVNKNLRPIIPVNCPPALRALIEQCWAHNPDKRPEFWQIVKVLEHFQSSLDRDGTLNLVQYSASKDHKKGLLHWIDKLGHGVHVGHVGHHASHHAALQGSPMPKPRFS